MIEKSHISSRDIIAVILISLLLCYWIFGDYLFHPNQYMMAFGGDALVIYYDMIFHTKYGLSSQLTNMNYPHGEYIYLTDAQGAFSRLFNILQKGGLNIWPNVVGLVHILNIYTIPLASVFMLLIFKQLNINKYLAIIASIGIVFLCPQMLRIGGHFGLAYLWFIPMMILWSMRKYRVNQLEWRDFLLFLTIVFFTFNNPYLGFSGVLFALAFAFLLVLTSFKNKEKLKTALIIGTIPMLSILTVFINFKLNDTINDRLQKQWGFFSLNASPEGSFYPPNSLIKKIIGFFGKEVHYLEYEKVQYVGIIPTLVIVLALGYYIYSKIKRTSFEPVDNRVKFGFIASILVYLYAANVDVFGEGIRDFLEENLGFILMFKASGRIGWSFYFMFGIAAVYYLNRWLVRGNVKKQLIVLPLIAVFWMIDINNNMKANYSNIWHNNFLSKVELEKVNLDLKNANIDPTKYQGILCLPKMQAWTDKFLSKVLWTTQFHSTRISLATGLPLLNAMLSRQSTSQTADAIQLLSHPLIAREKLAQFDRDKKVLVILGDDHPTLETGEEFIVNFSKKVAKLDGYTLLELDLFELNSNEQLRNALLTYYDGYRAAPLIHYNYDDQGVATDMAFYGKSAKQFNKGEHMLYNDKLSIAADTTVTISFWTRIDHYKAGLGDVHISVKGADGKELSTLDKSTRDFNDIQHRFIKSTFEVKVPKYATLSVNLIANQTFIIDEFMIDYKGHNSLIYNEGAGYFLYDGFKVNIPK